MSRFKVLLISILFFGSFRLAAYDAVGHRIITEVAYENLSCKARKKVDKILGKRGIVYYSSWADEIRSDKTYKYSYPWHYENVPENQTPDDLKMFLEQSKTGGKHLFYALDSLYNHLKLHKNDAEALKFVIHLVGDLHQPLHLGRSEDVGGHRMFVKWFGKNTKLHSIWDANIIQLRNMSSSEYAQYLSDKYENVNKIYKNYSFLQSVEASYSLVNEIYVYGSDFKDSYGYIYHFIDKVEDIMYRAGIQLANMLNDIYK